MPKVIPKWCRQEDLDVSEKEGNKSNHTEQTDSTQRTMADFIGTYIGCSGRIHIYTIRTCILYKNVIEV